MTILFRTRHGSHLYGLAHAGSDEDWYTVISNPGSKRKKYSKQTIHDGLDSTLISLSTFMVQCYNGVPQALESLFSQEPEVDLLTDFRSSYRINTSTTVATYKRTIKNFVLDGEASFKKRRHAARLTFNMNSLIEFGRFNPTMTPTEIKTANTLATLEGKDLLDVLERWDI